MAASRILEAKAGLRITRADRFPTASAGAGIADVRTAPSIPSYRHTNEHRTGDSGLITPGNAGLQGRVSPRDGAARANLLASEWARQEVVSALVANVASVKPPATSARPEAPDFETNARFAAGVTSADANSGRTGARLLCWTCARPSSWSFPRPARRFRPRTANRAAGKLSQHFAWPESR